MKTLQNKIVFISGASSGIGKACAELFAQAGAKLILCARSVEKVQEIADALKVQYQADALALKLDVQDKNAVNQVVDTLPSEWKKIDILVNNAGLARGLEKLHQGDVEDWEAMIDTNVKGLLYLTRKIVPQMLENKVNGHVINIGSIAGIHAYPGGAVYCATKSAVKFLSDGLRMDVVDTPIRVTNIQPGMVETNFSVIRFHGDQGKADNVYAGIKPLVAEDIADIVVYAASAPAHVQICEVTVTPTNQATGGVLHKEKK
ncbi:SDR family NAD(P)-dependent oxidoreductase [Pelosinus sp. UFO1]|uniref:SDR family NAD(P)-dependent oxidoreductase n=1 Tax=Pelosinus sp. UFO1 TaxID=484770 RepID=UPI0004D1F9D0|nr:SDR family NAD(P)-dependent oxidoreductase [Pelosinus sp. UFO1]AIF50534.1 Serine 3-dehydrogenase [Pelosinus sp. UFO1]